MYNVAITKYVYAGILCAIDSFSVIFMSRNGKNLASHILCFEPFVISASEVAIITPLRLRCSLCDQKCLPLGECRREEFDRFINASRERACKFQPCAILKEFPK